MKYLIFFIFVATSAFGCVCEPEINQAYSDIEKVIIKDNIDPLNDQLKEIEKIRKENIQAANNETEEFKILAAHERALNLMYREMLFEIQKQVDLQANQNKMIAIDVQTILKQNEGLAVIRAKKLEEK